MPIDPDLKDYLKGAEERQIERDRLATKRMDGLHEKIEKLDESVDLSLNGNGSPGIKNTLVKHGERIETNRAELAAKRTFNARVLTSLIVFGLISLLSAGVAVASHFQGAH